ncbi:MAG: hypothetical protein E4H37_08835 [Gemmatimonadales bacterium]|nr:MAG: hypothetical protein E4H37_08835 [Gemmatimonadales bacterium]
MTSIKRALLFGLLIWLIPFAVAFVIFPLRESSRPLFESIMPVAIAVATVMFGVLYFRRVTRQHLREGILIGLIWLVMCLLIDMPLMLLGGPMQMTLSEYISDIGVTYLMIPVITIGMGAVVGQRERTGT